MCKEIKIIFKLFVPKHQPRIPQFSFNFGNIRASLAFIWSAMLPWRFYLNLAIERSRLCSVSKSHGKDMNCLWFRPLACMKFRSFTVVLVRWLMFKHFSDCWYLLVNNTVRNNIFQLGHISYIASCILYKRCRFFASHIQWSDVVTWTSSTVCMSKNCWQPFMQVLNSCGLLTSMGTYSVMTSKLQFTFHINIQ